MNSCRAAKTRAARRARVLAFSFLLVASIFSASPPSSATPFGPGSVEGHPNDARVSDEFFGMGMDIGLRGTDVWPTFGVGTVRLAIGWRWIEQAPGVYDWEALDVRVRAIEAHGAEPLLTIIGTPIFHALGPGVASSYSAPSLPAYRNFVRALVARYGDRVDYQVWNEPSVEMFFAGTPEHAAEMTRILGRAVNELAPSAVAVSPSTPLRGDHPAFRKWFRSYLRHHPGRGERPVTKFFDAASVSAYPMWDEDPEDSIALVQYARRVLARHGFDGPLWATEINYGTNGPVVPSPSIPARRQAAYVTRTLVLHATLGADRVYWWHWVPKPNANTRLQDGEGNLTPAGTAYGVVQDWLTGTRPLGCETYKGLTTCSFRVGEGVERHILWTRSGRIRIIQAPEDAVSRTDTDGITNRIRGKRSFGVGLAPIMIEVRRG